MKDIVNEYGKTVLAVVLVGLLFVWIRQDMFVSEEKRGLFPALQKGMEALETDAPERADFQVMQGIAERKKPIVQQSRELIAGTNYSAEELFSVTDADGNKGHFRMIAIKRAGDDENIMQSVRAENGASYCFSEAGIYRIQAALWDDSGTQTTGQLYLKVENKKERER